MRFTSFSLKVFVYTLAFLSLISIPAKAVIKIDTVRPRILVCNDDVIRLRTEVKTWSGKDFEKLRAYVQRTIGSNSPQDLAVKKRMATIVRAVSFTGLVTESEKYIHAAVKYALALAENRGTGGSDIPFRERLLSMSYVYDWQYQHLTAKQKHTILKGIIYHINHLRPLLDEPVFTGGHGRAVSAAIMAGLIAIYNESDDVPCAELLRIIRDRWENGYNPFQSFVARDGGYHMGWRYGAAYTDPLPYLIWERSTGVRWCESWRKNQIFWYLYGLRGDETWERLGDCWDSSLHDQNIIEIAAVSAGLFKNSYAEWFYQQYYKDAWAPFRVFRIMFSDPNVRPLSPDDHDNPLISSRLFRNAGVVIARDSWKNDAALLLFKCSPFISINHHHKDQNHFSLSYKGSLLIDSGSYDFYGSAHWKNYYTRSIAHNTMIVFDPEEKFKLWGKTIANDGGQKFPNIKKHPKGTEPKDLNEVLSTKYSLSGITKYGTAQGCTWMRGDASKAYSEAKVQSYIRDIFMVSRPLGRPHPIILLLDRIQLRKKLIPKILFHSNDRPILGKNYFSLQNDNRALLNGEVLFPYQAKLDLTGGPGKEWWVDGKNYPPSKPWDDKNIDTGGWRIEVHDREKREKVDFVTVLSISDSSSNDIKPASRLISGEAYYGAVVQENLFLVNWGEKAPFEFVFNGQEFNMVKKVYLAGVPRGAECRVDLNGKQISVTSKKLVICHPE